jgi:ribose 5-phosphate isomerase B
MTALEATMTILIASDHAGFDLKSELLTVLDSLGYQAIDLGTDSRESVDYADYGHALASRLLDGDGDLGVLICGSGIGMSMAANRHVGIRAARCTSVWAARMCRRHNDANVLCLGERETGPGLARMILETFLETEFEGGRHAARVAKIEIR